MRVETRVQVKKPLLRLSLTQREVIAFYLFISPWLLGFLLFTLGPMIAAFLLSFTFYDVISPHVGSGLRITALCSPLIHSSGRR